MTITLHRNSGGIRTLTVKKDRIPESVIRRLPLYLRHLNHLRTMEIMTISSHELGNQLDTNPAQIRKDLAYFGEFGRKGVGYEVQYLVEKIEQILKLDRRVSVVLVGAGRLGTALCMYNMNRHSNLRIAYAFDNDAARIGAQIGAITVQPLSELVDCIQANRIRLGMITVPAPAAQEVADNMVASGVTAILNFAPVALRLPDSIHVRNADLTGELESLAYYAID